MVVGLDKPKSKKQKDVGEKKKKWEEKDEESSEDDESDEGIEATDEQEEEEDDDSEDDQEDESDDDDDEEDEDQPSPKKQKTDKQTSKANAQSPEKSPKAIDIFPVSLMGHMAGLSVEDVRKLCPEAVDVKWKDLHKSLFVTLKSEEKVDDAVLRLSTEKYNEEPLTVAYLGEKNESQRVKLSKCLPAKFNLLSLLVDDLPHHATEDDVKKAFPKASNIVMCLENSYASVYFPNIEDTEKAFLSSEKLNIKGNLVTVVYGSAEKPGDQYTLNTGKFPDETDDDAPLFQGEGFRGRGRGGRGRGDFQRGRGGSWRGGDGGDAPWRFRGGGRGGGGGGDWSPRGGGGDRGSWRGRGGGGDRGSWRGRDGGDRGSWRGRGGGGDGGERGSWRGRGGGDRGSWRGRGGGEGGSPWRGGGGGRGFRGGGRGFGGRGGGGFGGRGGDRGSFRGRGGRGGGFSRPDISD